MTPRFFELYGIALVLLVCIWVALGYVQARVIERRRHRAVQRRRQLMRDALGLENDDTDA